jgi:hypothetical protein
MGRRGNIYNPQKFVPRYGASSAMTVTNLQSLASSATAGWQSDRISNLSGQATDYQISVKLTTANTAPANDKAMYVILLVGILLIMVQHGYHQQVEQQHCPLVPKVLIQLLHQTT